MKKVYTIALTILIVVFTISIGTKKVSANEGTLTKQGFYQINVKAFGTTNYIYIDENEPLVENRGSYFTKAEEILGSLYKFSDNYNGFTEDPYKNNVYYINNNPGKEIKIDKILYELLEYSVYMMDLTDGYFDITIGKIIDGWKDIIENQDEFVLEEYRYTPEEINQKIKEIEKIPVITNEPIKLREDNKGYYVTIKEGVKLDLGAITKGYAVQKVYDYFKSEGLTYFHILGSASSLSYGSRNNELTKYKIKIGNPYYLHELSWADKIKQSLWPEKYPPRDKDIYGSIEVSNTSITTSGDTEQSARHGNMILHHIISPKTKRPENYYRVLTIIHPDAAYSDALGTALFSMDPTTFDNFIKKLNKDPKLKLSGYITFNFDMKIVDRLENNFEEWQGDGMKTTTKQLIIIISIIVIGAGAFYMFSQIFKNKKADYITINYNKQELARIDFEKQEVTLKTQNDTILDDVGEYPKHNKEEQTITVLTFPQEKIKGADEFIIIEYPNGEVRYEFILKYNMETRTVVVLQEICPDQRAMRPGEVSWGGLSCVPADITINFYINSENDNFDGEV